MVLETIRKEGRKNRYKNSYSDDLTLYKAKGIITVDEYCRYEDLYQKGGLRFGNDYFFTTIFTTTECHRLPRYAKICHT